MSPQDSTDGSGGRPGPLASWLSCPGCPDDVQEVTVGKVDGEHIALDCENCGSSVQAYHCEREYLEELV